MGVSPGVDMGSGGGYGMGVDMGDGGDSSWGSFLTSGGGGVCCRGLVIPSVVRVDSTDS